MKFIINVTFSKLMSLLILIVCFYLDIKTNNNNTTMFGLPFLVFLITGKQFFDRNKPVE